jgi:hypothetical protein
VLRTIFGPNREEVAGSWKRLHNEELHNLYASTNIIRVIISRRVRLAGHVARMGEMRSAYSILVGKPEEGKRPLGRSRCRWEVETRQHLRKIGWEGVVLMHVAQDIEKWRAVVNTVMKIRFP